jgi:hypothetical protein
MSDEKMAYDHEKDPAYATEEATKFDGSEGRRHSIAGGEAADVYGNTEEAEEFGYVERG